MKIDNSVPESRALAESQSSAYTRPVVVEQSAIVKDGDAVARISDPGDAILRTKISEMNARLSATGQEIAFEYNNESRKVVVRVIDKQTQQVLRQMPSAEALNLALTLDVHIGKVIRENA